MRVTQSMLSNTMLRNLNSSYTRMATLQEQISTGSKLLRPSDDPVGVTKAMSYRTQLEQNEQYQSNLDTATKWLDMSDDALGQVTKAMTRVQELITQAANDTNQTVDREKMLVEIQQIREEIKDIGNTKIGDSYIFSGTRTNEPVYLPSTPVDTTTYLDPDNQPVESIEMYTQKDGSTSTTARDAEGNLVAKVTNEKVDDPTYVPNAAVAPTSIYTTSILTSTQDVSIQTKPNTVISETPLVQGVVTKITDNSYAGNSLEIQKTTANTTLLNNQGQKIAVVDPSGAITDANGAALTLPLQLDINRSLSVDAADNLTITNTDNDSELVIDVATADVQMTTKENIVINANANGAIDLTTVEGTTINADAAGAITVNNPTPTLTNKNETTEQKVSQNLTGMDKSANVEIYNEIQLGVTTTGAQKMFAKLETVFAKVEAALKGDANGETSHDKLTALLGGTNSAADKANESIQGAIDLVLRERSQVGAKQNRVDMMADRLALQKEALTKQKSNVEDVEYEESITQLITQESIHRASLSVGGRIIQQTLVDFIR